MRTRCPQRAQEHAFLQPVAAPGEEHGNDDDKESIRFKFVKKFFKIYEQVLSEKVIQFLVSNAAIETSGHVDEISEADIEAMVHTNLTAPMRLYRQVLPGMLERGRGHLVAISSLAGVFPVPATSIYAATKAGLTHYNNIAWGDLKGTPIGVTTVEPGPVKTDMWDRFVEHPTVGRAVKRLGKMQLVPQEPPEKIASDVVRAVQRDRRHLRYPKRLYSAFLLESAPRRLTEALLVGQKPSR